MRKSFWLASTAMAVCALVGVAAPAVAATDQASSQPTTAVQEVVITAEKRVERLADAPVAASVVSTESLAATDSSDISDLNKLVPSVQLNGTFNGRVPMGVRGISSVSNEATVGIASGVEVLIDGVPVPSDSMAGNALEDVSRVEVLKGPQSTLGGRTASAGEINIVTFGPTPTFQGAASGIFTTDGEENVQGRVSGPITDQIGYSLAAWGHHLDYPIKNTLNGKYSDASIWGVRGKLLFHPNDNFDLTLAAHYGEEQSHGSNFTYIFATPGAKLLCGLACPPPGIGPSILTQALLLPGITPSWSNLNYNSPVPNSGAHLRDADVTLTLDYRLGAYTLSSTTSYQNEYQQNVQDLFVVGSFFFQDLCGCNVFLNTQTQTERIQQTTEELKLLSPDNQRVTYVVGAFFSDSTVQETYSRTLPPAAEALVFTPDTKTYDIYARGTWKLFGSTSVTGGLRYNYDVLSYLNFQTVFAQVAPPSCVQCYSAGSDTSGAIVGDISLQQKFGRDTMAYATYARGYAPRVYNTSLALTALNPPAAPSRVGPGGLIFTPADKLTPVGQETIDHFELGLKGGYFDHRLSIDAAAFDTRYGNYQVQSFSSTSGSINPILLLESAGGAETRGIEIDAVALPADHTTVGFDAAFIDARFTRYQGAPCWGGEPGPAAGGKCLANSTQDISGSPLPNAPRFKFNLSLDQVIPVEAWPVDIDLRGNLTYQTSTQMVVDQNPQAIQPSFAILNLSAGLISKDHKYALTLFVNNVTDHPYFTDVEDFFTAPWGGANTVVGQPARDARIFGGVRLEGQF
jgi:iron complex outermembrane receptor protein